MQVSKDLTLITPKKKKSTHQKECLIQLTHVWPEIGGIALPMQFLKLFLSGCAILVEYQIAGVCTSASWCSQSVNSGCQIVSTD